MKTISVLVLLLVAVWLTRFAPILQVASSNELQAGVFTLFCQESTHKKTFVWCGDILTRIKHQTDNNDRSAMLTNSKGFFDAQTICLCDRYLDDEMLAALESHPNVEKLVLVSDLVSATAIARCIASCRNLRQVFLDCPNAELETVEFKNVSYLEVVFPEEIKSLNRPEDCILNSTTAKTLHRRAAQTVHNKK